ncbi:hypothetical protein ACWX0P_28815 [Vibrio mediterranei]
MNELIYKTRQNVVQTALRLGMNSQPLQHLFGWDHATINGFLNASRLIVTLPHASPNVFFPRVAASWYAHHLQCGDERAFHLRVVLSHTNFSDLGWRPYAWWYLDNRRQIRKVSLFTRNKNKKHVTVISQPPLSGLSLPDMEPHQLTAYSMATECVNRAWSYVALMASTERAAGLSLSQRTMYITLDQLLVAVSQTISSGLSSLSQRTSARTLGPTGELQPVIPGEPPLVYDNATNIALISTLGTDGIVGGRKMLNYWSEVATCERALTTGYRPMEVLLIPENHQIAEKILPSQGVSNQLVQLGLPYSQGLALSEHGRFAEIYSPF